MFGKLYGSFSRARWAHPALFKQGGSILDIGCGWGGFLFYLAENYPDIKAIGITLSQEQYEYLQEEITKRGLSERLKIKLCDYRDIAGKYDFTVSIGMFEHVGKASYGRFMREVVRLLKPDGKALLHTIGLNQPPNSATDPWIEKYIFPGSRLPRLEEIVTEMRRNDLMIAHIENFKPHYAETLKHWHGNFHKNLSDEKRQSLNSLINLYACGIIICRQVKLVSGTALWIFIRYFLHVKIAGIFRIA